MITSQIKKLRKEIDQLDQRLVQILAQRKKIVLRIAAEKKRNSLSVYQPQREIEIHQNTQKVAQQLNLNPQFIKNLFNLILKEMRKVQKNLKRKKTS